jgi:purine-cytosine permease-like protein
MSTSDQDRVREDRRQERIVTRYVAAVVLIIFLGLAHGCYTGEFSMKFNKYDGCVGDQCEAPKPN